MIGDFPIQFSIYTNCPLHHVFLAWEACGSLRLFSRHNADKYGYLGVVW